MSNLIRKIWVKRRNFSTANGQVVSVSLKDIGCFYLKLSSHCIKGATCFNDLKTYDGVMIIISKKQQ